MRHVAVLADQVGDARPPIPGRGPAPRGVVTAGNFASRVLHRLRIDVKRGLVVGRARHAEAEVGRRAAVVLKPEARAPSRGVFHRAAGGDRSDSCRVPVHAVEDDQHDVLLTRIGGRHLQPVDVGLVEVLRLGIEGAVRQPAVECHQFLRVAVDAVGAAHHGQRHAEGIDRNEPVRVAGVGDILLRMVAPVAPDRVAGGLGFGLHGADAVGLSDVQVFGRGGGDANGPSGEGGPDERGERGTSEQRAEGGGLHSGSIPAECGPKGADG